MGRNINFGLTEVLDMPYLRAFYTGVRGNKIETSKLEVTNITTSQVCSGVDGYWSRKDASKMNVGELIHKNIRHLVHGDVEKFTYIGQGDNYKQAFMPDVLITERMLTNSYDSIRRSTYNDRALNLCKIEQFFTCRKVTDIMRQLVIEFAKGREGKEIYASEAFDDHVKTYLETLVSEQIEEAKKLIVELKGKGSLAITSSRDDIDDCDKKAWYGAYFKDS